MPRHTESKKNPHPSWFSPKYFEYNPKSGLYRCLLCPERYQNWRTRTNMRIHRHRSTIHRKLLEAAENPLAQGTEDKSRGKGLVPILEHEVLKDDAVPEMTLYYPTESPDEPVHRGTRVTYEGSTDFRAEVQENRGTLPARVAVASDPNDDIYCCVWCQQVACAWRPNDHCEGSFTRSHMDVRVGSLNSATLEMQFLKQLGPHYNQLRQNGGTPAT